MTDRELLESLLEVFAAASREADNLASGRRGMQVTYTHAFAGVLHLPGVVRDVRRLERMIREHLEKPHD